MEKIRIELRDTGDGLRVSPDFIHRHVKCIEGDAYLDYDDGDEPLRLVEAFDDIMIAVARAERR